MRQILQSKNNHVGSIFNEDKLLLAIKAAREHDETIMMTNGGFDILHPGLNI